MDEIRIKNLEVYAYHGVYEEENRKGQPFYINLVLYTQLRNAGNTDDLTASTNYGEVCHFVDKWMKKHTVKLIETVAEELARGILYNFPLIQSLDIEIRKPEAPVGLPFDYVSVKLHRGWHTAYVAIGSNLGEKEDYIRFGIDALKESEDIEVLRVADVITTKAYGVEDQPDFLNSVIEIKTLLTPDELLDALHDIENRAGRERTLRWGPRTLDLDIVLYDDLVMGTESLIIPHVDMENREFVLAPLVQLVPWKRHPVLHKTMEQLWHALQVDKEVFIR